MTHNTDALVLQIGKESIPVTVSSEGEFWAEWESDSYHSTTFKGLREKLLKAVRTDLKRCSVVMDYRKGGYTEEIEPITLIGIHAGNGNVLYTTTEGKTEQMSPRRDQVMDPLTSVEHAQWKSLCEAVKVAERTKVDWIKRRVKSPLAIVRAALGLPALPAVPDHDWDED